MSKTYRVLLNGVMTDRSRPSEVAGNLAVLFRVPVEKVWPSLAKPGTAVKRRVDLPTAARYHAALERAGCSTVVMPEAASTVSSPPTEPEAAVARVASRTVGEKTSPAAAKTADLESCPKGNKTYADCMRGRLT